MNGKLAQAYHSLLEDMWLAKDSKTAPHDLKRVLGKRVARFSGYGQQDACELLNYLLDLIHEDLNRVKKKPYVEMPDSDGHPDEELSNLFWNGFLARNQSIIVDLMYGQLKSTVTCLECHNISISFDPFLTLSLPISRPSLFVVALVPYEVFRRVMGDSDEEDPDYKDPREFMPTEHPYFKFEIDSSTRVIDIKKQIIERVSKIGERQIVAQNLKLGLVKWGELTEVFEDNHLVEQIDQSGASLQTVLIETQTDEKPLGKDQVLTEFNFSSVQLGKKGSISQKLITSVLPRFEVCSMSESMLDLKKKIFKRIQLIFKKPKQGDFTDDWINKALILYIKDTCPELQTSSYSSKKANCEFCGNRHNIRDDICDVKSKHFKKDGNSFEAASKIKLEDLYDQLKYKRDLKFEVMINQDMNANTKALSINLKMAENQMEIRKNQSAIQIENCFKEYGVEELLTGTDQWYCGKCKEHRDIHKKLELYRVPKILMLQIKRFQSKKSANNGKSGFFNLAYAQICQQEKVSELVEFPLEGLDIEPFVK